MVSQRLLEQPALIETRRPPPIVHILFHKVVHIPVFSLLLLEKVCHVHANMGERRAFVHAHFVFHLIYTFITHSTSNC